VRTYRVSSAARILTVLGLCLALGQSAGAVVLHDDSDPVPTGTANRPSDALMGRWSTNGSCVAIGPNHVVTTQHQGVAVGQPVVINGVDYVVAEFFSHGAADMRLARITTPGGADADLTEYATLYTGTGEAGMTAVIGGYGMGRGDDLTTGGQVYGYGAAGDHNETLRWGANRIDLVTTRTTTTKQADILWADFDDTGTGGHVAHEASVGYYDSGGGWFVLDDGEWKLAGSTWTVLTHYAAGHEGEAEYCQSWFRKNYNPSILAPDPMDATRISSYAGWLTYLMDNGPAPGDATRDGVVDVMDLAALANHYGIESGASWYQGDFNGDGAVDVHDLAALANTYTFGTGTDAEFGGASGGVELPEPASAAVLLIGLPVLMVRRRGRRRGDRTRLVAAPAR